MMAHIFLYGPPGSGKSTIGKALAASLQMPFIDLDKSIELKMGRAVSLILEQSGEEGFRNLEEAVLKEDIDRPEAVIALGGGTLLRAASRRLVEASGQVICLQAAPRVLLERLRADGNTRPLLAGNLAEQLALLLAKRADHYGSFDMQINSDHPVEQACRELQTTIGRFHLSAMGSYDVLVEDGGIERIGEMLRARGVRHTIIVTDENVNTLYAKQVSNSLKQAGYEADVLVIPAGESYKTLESIAQLWHGFLKTRLDRTSTVIALGGGVVSDLGGFAASTFMRGIDWVCVPTTLLAMVDASIGGKTAFDLPEGKNLIGSFHAPRLVLADLQVLHTLPDIEYRVGLAEAVKHGVIADPDLFSLCAAGAERVQASLSEILRRAVAVKISIIERDPYETGERAALNFGHTVGHAVEAASAFSVRHGEAVAMGMVMESDLSERLGIARHGLSGEISAALSTLGLPIRIPGELPLPILIGAMQNDKKRTGGKARFALPSDIGRVQFPVEVVDLQSVFEDH